MIPRNLKAFSLADMEKGRCARWFFIAVLVLIPLYVILTLNLSPHQFWKIETVDITSTPTTERSRLIFDKPEDFEGFNNVTGTPDGCYIVPNYIHFVRLWEPEFKFYEAVTALAAFKNQRPEKIFFHSTEPNFRGKYWEVLKNTPGFMDVVHINVIEAPMEIFGKKLGGYYRHHSGDIVRLRMLMQYGGIFLDNDSYIVRSLDDFRRFEMALAWMENENLANQVIIAHKNARFLRLWLDTYHKYDGSCWYCNAGVIPTQDVLVKKPYLIHRVKDLLAAHDGIITKVFMQKWDKWRNHYALHLLINHQYLLKNLSDTATYPVEFNDTNFKNYQVTFRDLVYDVYPVDDKPS